MSSTKSQEHPYIPYLKEGVLRAFQIKYSPDLASTILEFLKYPLTHQSFDELLA